MFSRVITVNLPHSGTSLEFNNQDLEWMLDAAESRLRDMRSLGWWSEEEIAVVLSRCDKIIMMPNATTD